MLGLKQMLKQMLKKIYTVICAVVLILCTPAGANDDKDLLFNLGVLLMEQSIRTQQQYVRTQQQFIRTQYQGIRTQQQWIRIAQTLIDNNHEDSNDLKTWLTYQQSGVEFSRELIVFQSQDIHKVQGMILENENNLKNIKWQLIAITHDVIEVFINGIRTFEERILQQELAISNMEQDIMQTELRIEELVKKMEK